MLAFLLNKLECQRTNGLFGFSIIVVDNDPEQSARDVCDRFKQASNLDLEYYIESATNIALVRNSALTKAKGDFIALIDDDEFPTDNWLINLYRACRLYNADGVLGPLRPHYQADPPEWVQKGAFWVRGENSTGAVLKWYETRAANALIRRHLIDDPSNLFNPAYYRGWEDVDFFTRLIEKGYVFVWCNEAMVFENIPPERCTRSFMVKRALLRGKVSAESFKPKYLYMMKSIAAVPAYTILLPFSLVIGQHMFMKNIIRLFEHFGRLLALCKLDLIRQPRWR